MLVASSVPLRTPHGRAHAGPALLGVGICSGLVGEAFALFPYVLWTHAWYDQYGAYLADIGGFFLLSAGLFALASGVALTDASWARGGLLLLRVVMGLMSAGSPAALLYRYSSWTPDQTLWGWLLGVLVTLGFFLNSYTFLLVSLSLLFGPLIVIGALIALVRRPTLRALVLREGVLGTFFAALVVVLLVARGPLDWKEAPFGLDALLASFAVGTALFLVEYRRTRHHTPPR